MTNSQKTLTIDQLYRTCDPELFHFDSTENIHADRQSIGQERALDAIKFGINIQKDGYNLYVLGSTESGKHTLVREVIQKFNPANRTVYDWCYVNNFTHPHQPLVIRLAAGNGEKLKQEIQQFTDTILNVLPKAFEAESYTKQLMEINNKYRAIEDEAFENLESHAKEHNIAFLQSDAEFTFAPMNETDVLKPEEYEALTEEQQIEIQHNINLLQEELQTILQKSPGWQQECQESIKNLNIRIAKKATGYWISNLKRQHKENIGIIRHIHAIEEDILENVESFFPQRDMQELQNEKPFDLKHFLKRYHINLIVEHKHNADSPVVYETNPTLENLIGKIDNISQYGALLTDFSLIKAGALHKANNGFLIIDGYKVLDHPNAWEALKRALSSREIMIDPLQQSTITLSPAPIPLNVKVILLGDHHLYFSLYEHDPEFIALFKVIADFATNVPRNAGTILEYAELMKAMTESQELRPFDRSAIARIIEQSSRWIEDSEKLSTHVGKLRELMTEADYWAQDNDHPQVIASDVQRAIDQQLYRVARLKSEVHESILRDTTIIKTDGKEVGQINGLTIASLGYFTFGQPSKISALARLGDGKIIDIEHEADLSGDIHTKGILILASFFNARYAKEKNLSFNASIAFEQSYGEIDGDSASAAELAALVSAITDIPLKQNIAITGSINQHGIIQAVGGINEKIEGYYEICDKRGLTGDQGVIIPSANVHQLMLKKELRSEVAKGKFTIYPVDNIDQVLSILTDMPAGTRDKNGLFETGSVNEKVESRLISLAKIAHDLDDNNHHENQSDD